MSAAPDRAFADAVSQARHELLTPRDQLALGLFGLPASYIVWLSSEFRHIELSTIMGMHHANVGEDDLMRARSSLGQELSPGALLMSKWSSRPAS